MPQNRKPLSNEEFFAAGGQVETKPRPLSNEEFFSNGGTLKDPDKYQTKGLLEEKPEHLQYSLYKAARNVPIIGEIAARAGDYVIGAFDPNRSASEVRAEREAKEMNFEQDNPRLSTIAGFGGALVNPVPIPAFGALNEIKTATKLGKLAKGTAQVGGVATREAAIAGTDASLRGLDAKEVAEQAGKTAGVIGVTAKAVPVLGSRFAKYGLGVKEPAEIAAKYSARKSFINAANEENLVDSVMDNADTFRNQTRMADEAVDIARKENAAAREALRTEIRGTRPPETLAKDVIGSIDSLSAKVSEGSNTAFDILSNSDAKIPLPKIKAFLTQKLRQYQSPNKTYFPGAEAESAELAQWLKYFDDIGGKTARPEEIKGLIQYLDRKTGPIYAKRVDERTIGERDLIDFRRFMDSFLKEDVPGYADAMKPVAKDAALLKQARKMFDGELRADRTLERIGKPFKEKELQTLKDLSEATGTDLISPMQEYMSAQRSTSGPSFAQKSEMLPEFGQMKRVEAARDLVQEENRFAEKFTRTGDATQARLKALRSESKDPINLRRDLEKLSKKTGIDFVQMNDDLAVKEAFQKGATNGSRLVNWMSVMGAGTGGLVGGATGATIGAAIGSTAGAIIDKSGPRLFQAYLDLSMTPIYKGSVNLIFKAAEKGPQAAAQMQKQIMAKDAEFKAAVEAHVQGQLAAEEETKKQGFRVPEQVGFSIPGR